MTRPTTQTRDHRVRDWRAQLDERIDTCPGCDQWRWDRHCRRCDETDATDITHATHEEAA